MKYTPPSRRPQPKAIALYSQLSLGFSVFQVVLGAAFFIVTASYLFEAISRAGQIVGAEMILAGGVAILGILRRDRNWLGVHVILGLLGMFLCFHFLSQVQRDLVVDCALADLSSRVTAMERLDVRRERDDLFAEVFSKIDEMEETVDMLKNIHENNMDVKTLEEANTASQSAKVARAMSNGDDRAFIEEKLNMLQQQAQTILQESSSFEMDGMSQADKDKLENRIDAAKEVLRQTNSHLKDGEPMSVHDYERILRALKKAVTDSPDHAKHKDGKHKPVHKNIGAIDHALKELPVAREKWARKSNDFYLHYYAYDDYAKAYDDYGDYGHARSHPLLEKPLNKDRAERKIWREKFKENAEKMSKELMRSGQMPEHCLKDRKAHKYGLLVSGIVAVVNMATAYLVTALLIRTPLKKD